MECEIFFSAETNVIPKIQNVHKTTRVSSGVGASPVATAMTGPISFRFYSD